MQAHEQHDSDDLAEYAKVADWQNRYGSPFFETRSSFDWFIKQNRRELIDCGALIPRHGRSGSLVSVKRMPDAVIRIFKRKALSSAAE